MDFSWNVVQPFIDREFGGVGATHTEEIRPVTSIERTVMARVATRALADLEAAWAPMIKIQVSDAELETNPEFMQICAPADTVILIAFEVKTEHMSGRIFLCYPYFTIEPVCALMTPRSILDRQLRRKDTREHRLQGLKRVPTELRIVWGRGNFSPADVACIKVGDTIVLDTKASDPAIIYVEDQPLFLSRPGTGEGGSCSAEVLEATPPVDDFDPLYLEGRHMSDASTAGKASSVKQTPDPNWPRDLDARLCRVGGATVEVTVELGRTQIPLEEVLQIEPGNVIETRKVTGQPMDILVNGALYAKGEVVVIGDDLAIRITDLIEH